MKSSILPSQEGSTFQSQVLKKLEKAQVVIPPLTTPLQKLAHSLGVMLLPLPSMEIHFDLNFTKKKAKHRLHIQETKLFKKQG